ncbi:MAG: polymer-forming cytoskeletal protein [Candidatus Falkowbacteria bacterium]|nr:polymer-forming cytoskeletal protein [Candidatus Falkowbacteria bacterium]
MFNKDNRAEKFKDAETIIGGSIKVKGNFHGQGNIVIEGRLEGSLKTNASLFVGEQAKIVANIEAQDAIINGEVYGEIKIKKYLSLGSTAKIFGDIQYAEISVEHGATINGQLTVKAEVEDNKRKEKAIIEEEVEELPGEEGAA